MSGVTLEPSLSGDRTPTRQRLSETPCKYAGMNYFDGIAAIRADREQERTAEKEAREPAT